MTKKCIISVLLVVAWAFLASLFYKTLMLMLLFLVWKKHIFEMLPAWTQKWGMKPYWMLFFVCLLSLIHISEPTRLPVRSRMPSSA